MRRIYETRKRITEGVEVQRSSRHVFADLGLADTEKLKIKTALVAEISKAMRGDFTNLSERKLMDCLNRLGYDMESRCGRRPIRSGA